LYLEWAPINTFEKSGAPTPPVKEDTKEPEAVEPPQDTENKTIFVKNLNFETTEDVLKRHMESVGDVASVKIISKNGQPMGFGFVEYMTARGAKKAM
jgi:RNA recognition motif-containing protein